MFYLVKKLIRFLGNSAIRQCLLANRVSVLEKYSFFNPRHPCGYGGISPLHPPFRQPLPA